MSVPARYEIRATPQLAVSFQRYRRPAAGLVAGVPRSCGALPVAQTAPGEWVVPCPPGEAVWIGLVRTAAGPPCRVVVGSAAGTADADVPPDYAVVGVPAGGGYVRVLTLGASPRLDLRVAAAGASPAALAVALAVALVDAAAFAALTGVALPGLDESASYGGGRLP